MLIETNMYKILALK